MKKRLSNGCGSVVLILGLLVGLIWFQQCREGWTTECNYGRIRVGMTIAQADALLGPGEEQGRESVPGTRDGPVVTGDRFRTWEDRKTGRKVWVGLEDGKVGGKWFYEPSS